MSSNMFGTFDQGNQVVTLNGKQTVSGQKNFTSDFNTIAGTFIQPHIEALGSVITPTILSYLSGTTSNIQTQLNNSGSIVTQLNQALQALEPAPNAITVQFNKNVLVKDNATPTLSSTLSDQQIIINNGSGGTINPVVVLNQVSLAGGSLVQEIYNQKTAATGEFHRTSFYAKNSSAAKIEYARIHQNAPSINPARGKLDFDVATGGANPTNFLSINGSTQQVDIFRTLHMNAYPILSTSNIYTPNNNTYGKNVVQFFAGDATIPTTTPDDQMRLTLINEGVPDTVQPLPGSFPVWGTILCSVDFNGYTYVGTDNGFVYFSNDGNTWLSINDSFNGRVLCMTVFNGELYVGGDFKDNSSYTVSYKRIARVDSSGNVYQVNWANYMAEGFDGEVRTLCASSSGYLYMGGKFTNDSAGLLYCPYIAVMDSGFNLYCLDYSSATGYGFNNLVNFIAENASYAPNTFIIGGEFDTMYVASGSYTAPKNIIWGSDGTYNTNVNPYYFVSMNNAPVCITQNGSNFYIGGNFQGLPYGDYLANFEWNGSAYVISPNPYGFSSTHPIIAIYQNAGIYWSDVASQFFDAGVMVATAPFGNWSWIHRAVWGQLLFSTDSPSQNPYVAYYLDSSNVITLTLSSGEIYNGPSYYTGGVILYDTGSVVDLVYKANFNRWYVVSQIGAGFF